MFIGLGLGLCSPVGGGQSVFNPGTLSLSGWWRGSYSGSSWSGTASAGASGSRSLSPFLEDPVPGDPVNGYTPAVFDGTNAEFQSALALDDFFNAGAWSAWVLFNAAAAATDPGEGARWQAPQFWTDPGAWMCMGFSAGGVHAFNNAANEVVVACGTGAWHLAQAKFDGTNLLLRVDSGAWSSVASSNTTDLTGSPIRVGTRYDGSGDFNGQILDMAFADSALSDDDFDDIVSYVNARYALSL